MTMEIQSGTLYIVATPIGNLRDITYRAVEVLREVELIAAEDTRKTKILLDFYEINKPMISYFSQNEHRRVPELINRLQYGSSVALVTDAGTPGISDPAYAIVHAAIEAGIQVVPLPGPTAFVSALVASGLPTDAFVFEGFLPMKKGRQTLLRKLALEERTVILYESPHKISKTLGEIHQHFGDRYVVIAREMTKKFEEFLRGPVSEVKKELEGRTVKGEFVVVIKGKSKKDGEREGRDQCQDRDKDRERDRE